MSERMNDTFVLKGSAGTYQNKSGETKKKWVTMGNMYFRNNRWSMKIDAIPAAGWDGWISAFDPEEDGESSRQSSQPTRRGRPSGGFEDMQNDVPFN